MADLDRNAEIPPPSPVADNENKASCMVCYNTFHSKSRVPKILPCGHSFCQECIQALITNNPHFNRGLHCPTCRKTCLFENPYDPIASISTNFVLREVLEKQEENDSSQGNKYGCRHCQNEHHEKDLMKCDTCSPRVRPDDSVDFMGRANLLLACSSCMEKHHQGHLFQSKSAVASRWKHRSLFEKFAKTVDGEAKRFKKFISVMTDALETAKLFERLLHETARQVQNNHGHRKIDLVLKNFIRGANESAKFVNMSTECLQRFVKADAPQNSMLGQKLFEKRRANTRQTCRYAPNLSRLFEETDRATPLPAERNVIHPERTGPTPVAPDAPIDQPPMAPVIDVQNEQAGQQNPYAVYMDQILQALNVNYMPQNNVLNVVLNQQQHYQNQQFYYQVQQLQQQIQHARQVQLAHQAQQEQQAQLLAHQAQQAQIAQQAQQAHLAQLMNLNDVFQYDNFEPGRPQGGHAFRIVPGRQEAPHRVQNYFVFPIHVMNEARGEQETLGDIIRRLVDNIPVDEVREEVFNFFFVPPYEAREFAPHVRHQICDVLSNIMNQGLLIRDQMPHVGFEQLHAALNALNEEQAPINVGDNRLIDEEGQMNQAEHEVVVIDDEDDNDNDDDDDDVLIIEDTGNPNLPPINNEQAQKENPLNQNQQQIDEEDQIRLPVHRPAGHIFEAADFLPPPPAQSTRSALKRNAPTNRSNEDNHAAESGASTSGNNRSNSRAKRKRGE